MNKLTLRAIDDNAKLLCVDGRSAENFAYYNDFDKSVYIKTDKIDENRCEKAVIRQCDWQDQLIELFFDIEVVIPRFESYVRKYYEVPTGVKTIKYQLPAIIDSDNKITKLNLDPIEGKIPPTFMKYDQESRQLIFQPKQVHDEETYYFKL